MAGNSLTIDLDQFKLDIHCAGQMDLCLHFDSPSRRFYLSVIALVINEMKRLNRIIPVSLSAHHEILALLNETVGSSAGSSTKQKLIPRIYKKWKNALPDIENAPLFRIPGKKKSFEESYEKIYAFSEGVKDAWANLFDYKGSNVNVRLRFSIDRLGIELDNVSIIYDEASTLRAAEAWDRFIINLRQKAKSEDSEPNVLGRVAHRAREAIKKYMLPMSMAFGIILLIGSVIVIWNLVRPQTQFIEPGSSEKSTSLITEKTSIAVLPFDNMSDDPEQGYFCDGITEDIITDLSKIKDLLVISKNSTFTYKGKDKKIRELAEELKVQYILEGSVRRTGEQLRINTQLIDARKDYHIWAERYDDTLQNIFELQDKITKKIVSALSVKLSITEESNVTEIETTNIIAYEYFLKGKDHLRKVTPEDWLKAIEYFSKAVKIDPNYSRASAALGYTYQMITNLGFHEALDFHERYARRMAHFFLKRAMKKPTFESYSLAATIEIYLRHYKEAIAFAEKGLSITPNDPEGNLGLGWILIFSGRPEEGIKYLNKALRLDPNPNPQTFNSTMLWLGVAKFSMGQLDKAIEYITMGQENNPELKRFSCIIAASYALLGKINEAKQALDTFLALYPKGVHPDIQELYHAWPFSDVEVFDRLAKGLVMAGLRGDPSNYYKVVLENKLTGKEIRETLYGHTMVGIIPGGQWMSKYDIDGNFDFSVTRVEADGTKLEKKDKGRSWIEGDADCYQYDNRYDGFMNCEEYYRNPDGSVDTYSEYIGISYAGMNLFSMVN